MHQSIRTFLIIIALGAAAAPTAAQTATPGSTASPQDVSKRVRQLVHQAGDSIRAARYEEARRLLLEAWGLQHAPDVAGVLAQSEIELKRYADAAEHLDFAIANFSPTQSDKLLETLRQAFEDAKTHVGQLKIVTNRDGADIIVDGRVVGKSPLQTVVYVEPGRHEVRVKQGDDSEMQAFDVAAGKAAEAMVTLRQPNATPVVTSSTGVPSVPLPYNSPSSPPVNETSERSILPVVIGGLVFVAGVGTAVGFHFAANSQHDKLQSYRDKNGSTGCTIGTASASDCAGQWDAGKAVERDRNWSTAGIVVGGTALVATGLYWFWPREKSAATEGDHKSLQVTGSIQSKGPGISVSGEF